MSNQISDTALLPQPSEAGKLLQMYRLRAGITQSKLARQLNLKSERMVRNWEGGFNLPSAGRLKEIIAFYLGQGIFTGGREHEEAFRLWQAVKLQADKTFIAGQPNLTAGDDAPAPTTSTGNSYSLFDNDWFEALLNRPGETKKAASTVRQVNLPRRSTPLVGREADLKAARQMLEQPGLRLLTLTGPGGIGKTSLAVELAGRLDGFCREVIFVALETISDKALVLPAIAAASGLTEPGGLEPALQSQIAARLTIPVSDGEEPCFNLLILDNFEQLAEAGSLAEWLLENCPGLKLLITSRSPLGIPGEVTYPVKPLELPTEAELNSARLEGGRFSAMTLFVQRAIQAQPDFELTAANTPDIARICARLDGLPLALELAAGWINILSPRLLLERLKLPLYLLEGERGPVRHQTLRRTLEWSYTLLEPGEQRLFRHLAVFVNGCEVEAVEVVCENAGEEGYVTLKHLRRLVDKSLLTAQAHRLNFHQSNLTSTRLRMLQTVREYGLEVLRSQGKGEEEQALRQRHAAYYLKLARQAITELRGPNQADWLSRLESENDNFRAALEWGIERHEEMVMEMAGYLAPFWDMRGYLSEGRRWLDLALKIYPQPTMRRAIALNAAGNLAYKQALYPAAISLLEENLAIHRLLDNRPNLAQGLGNLGVILFHLGDYAQAQQLYQESLALKRETGNPRSIAASLNNLGELLVKTGDFRGAQAAFEEGLALQRQAGDKLNIAILLLNLGELACQQENLDLARSFLEESLSLFQDLSDQLNLAEVLERFGLLTLLEGQVEISATLFGAAQAVREKLASPMSPTYRAIYEEPLKKARNLVGENAWQAANEAGLQMPLDEAVGLAGSSQPDRKVKLITGLTGGKPGAENINAASTVASPALNHNTNPVKPVSLSKEKFALLNERELEILGLLAGGYSNLQVATELVITLNTVKWHLKNIYSKLDVNSRTQAISRAGELGLV